jgi:hypothetical protein
MKIMTNVPRERRSFTRGKELLSLRMRFRAEDLPPIVQLIKTSACTL